MCGYSWPRFGRQDKTNHFLLFLSLTILLMFMGKPASVQENESLWTRLAGPIAYDNPELIDLVNETFLHPPSSLPYNLMQDQLHSNVQAKFYNGYKGEFAYEFCQKAIQDIFKGVKSGFFVEAGAVDGEYLSNTLPLELESNWTGLLIEVDRDMFKELLTKQRKAWASHCCLATRGYPHQDILLKYAKQDNSVLFSKRAASAHASLVSIRHGLSLDLSEPGHRIYERVQCLPLATLLLAVGVRHVDMISLDVEGAEVGILENFPWDVITVDVWVVEHTSSPSSQTYPSPNLKNKVPLQHTQRTTTKSNTITGKTIPRPTTDSTFPFQSPITESQPIIDQDFINFFKRKGYELYSVSKELFIPNYVFVLRGSRTFERLMSEFT